MISMYDNIIQIRILYTHRVINYHTGYVQYIHDYM